MNERYAAYLRTPHWHTMRAAKLADSDYQCERCGEFGRRGLGGVWLGIQVHHLTYERLGSERLSDLEVLCICCHEDEHGIPHGLGRREEVRRKISHRITARTTGYDGTDEWDIAI